MTIVLKGYNLSEAEKLMVTTALAKGGSIIVAAQLLGITRHGLKRRIIRLGIEWPPSPAPAVSPSPAPQVVALQTLPEAVPDRPKAAVVVVVAAWVFSKLELVVPRRMQTEDLGDACEDIAKMARVGVPLWQIWARMFLIIYWTVKKAVKGP